MCTSRSHFQMLRFEYLVIQRRNSLPETNYSTLSALFSVGLFFEAVAFLTCVLMAITFLGSVCGGVRVYPQQVRGVRVFPQQV